MSKSQGMVGIDVAYTIAIFGTVFSNIYFVIGDQQHFLSHTSYFMMFDVFPAMFFFLNGFTFSLSTRERKMSSRRLLSASAKKGSVLFVIGLIFIRLWATNLFLACGIFFMLSSVIGNWGNFALRTLTIFAFAASAVLVNLAIPSHPEFSAMELQGAGFRDFLGYLLFNGYYSILPWFTFYLAGMAYGRTDIRPKGWFPPTSLAGAAMLVFAVLAQIYTKSIYSYVPTSLMSGMFPFTTSAYLPSFVLYAVGISIIVINILKYVFRKSQNRPFNQMVRIVASSKFSIYGLMLVIGSIILGLFNLIIFKQVIILLVLDVALCAAIYYLIRQWNGRMTAKPPVEWLIQRITNASKS
jgi:uncharacterized protein